MTIEEFREQNPNIRGNLCWNCTRCCVNRYPSHNGNQCDDFIMIDHKKSINNEQRAIALKVLREEYNSIMGDASNYFYTKIYRRR